MKLSLPLAGAWALFVGVPFAYASESETRSPPPGTATQILIDLRDDTNDDDEHEVEARLGGIDIRLNSIQAKKERFFIADVDPSRLSALIAAVKDDPRVEHVEPNFIYSLPPGPIDEAGFTEEGPGTTVPEAEPEGGRSGERMVPDDPLWERQWSFRMVDAPAAWEHTDGQGVVVAIIDTGVAYEDFEQFKRVEDLAKTEFVKGYDFVSDDEHPNDDHGHGTHVAGTIAQSTNNAIGVAGLAHGAKIMPLKVLNRSGMGTAADIADAIRFAADEGANVINLSLGGGSRSLVMESAVAYARKKGLVVVCAAGNGSRGHVEFPAAYPGAFAVSAVGPDKKLAFYSSWGKELALAAPGGDKQKGGDNGAVLQNTIAPDRLSATNLYLAFQGTSMAAPHVAAAAALVMSAGVTDPSKVEAILKDTAEHVGQSGWDERYGAGILNVGKAVESAEKETGGFWYFIAGIATLGLFMVRVGRRMPRPRLGLAALLGTVLGASGLWFLKALGLGIGRIPIVSLFTTGMPNWDTAVFGASWHSTALWASAVPVFCLAVALLGTKRLRGFLVGLALGWAAHLLILAVLMPSDVQFIPGLAGVLDRMWLVLNAGILAVLARLIAMAESARHL